LASPNYLSDCDSLPCDRLPTNEINPVDHTSPVSSRSTWRDPSAGFETDSTCSDGDADYEEDNISWDDPDAIAKVCKQLQVTSAERARRIIDPIISPLKESLVERIMGDFWSLFNQEWSENIRKRTVSPSTHSSVSSSSSKSLAEKSNKKHKRTTDDNGYSRQDEDENEGSKRPRRASASVEDGEDSRLKFSCPYRKHNPRKYTHCDRVWRTCALAPFSTVARVKYVSYSNRSLNLRLNIYRGHLYRNHRIFQCRRCNERFRDDDALQNHFMAINSCSLQEPAPAEGITATLEKQLRSKKWTGSAQTQEERWKEIYRILFPMEIVPSACKCRPWKSIKIFDL
jgi:hypothetical protein